MTEDSDTPTSVYRYYDRFGVLIYVGITKQGMGRNRQHNATQEWWSLVCRQEVEHHPTRRAAEARERELIRQHRPPFNKQHNLGWQEMRAAYLAFVDSLADADARAEAQQRSGRIRATVTATNVLTTLPGDGIVVADLVVPPGSAVVSRKGIKIGSVRRADRHGPLLAITVSGGLPIGAEVDLVTKWIGANQDRVLTLKHVVMRKKAQTSEQLEAKQAKTARRRQKEMLRGRGKVIFRWWSEEFWVDYIVQSLWVPQGHTRTWAWEQATFFDEVA